MKKGLIRLGLGALALAVLGPAVAESQILIICGVYRNSHPDTGNNVCHGTGPGCMECTVIMLNPVDEGAPVDSQRQNATVASHTPRLLEPAEEPDQPVSLALHTGLPLTPLKRVVCDAPDLFDRVRIVGQERVLPVVKDRSRSRLWKQASAR